MLKKVALNSIESGPQNLSEGIGLTIGSGLQYKGGKDSYGPLKVEGSWGRVEDLISDQRIHPVEDFIFLVDFDT